ncbi:hypothetical protein DPEC_G00109550 [Dallia pectoralis]|uniref:Uncharacterized protein n=1 Tax=Dallia pectoralis TaxID=75939 RepID=A0ACC2GSR0_DALPE|nr:hypothetical protein DPEC_G00109550 [Dallia pectoralis]
MLRGMVLITPRHTMLMVWIMCPCTTMLMVWYVMCPHHSAPPPSFTDEVVWIMCPPTPSTMLIVKVHVAHTLFHPPPPC